MVTFLGLHKGGEGSEGFDQYRRKKSWSLFHLCGHFLGVAQGGGDPLGGGGVQPVFYLLIIIIVVTIIRQQDTNA